MTISIRYSLPFSLDVEGVFPVSFEGENYDVQLIEVQEQNPTMPGASSLVGINIVNDDGNMIHHTDVSIRYTPRSTSPIDPRIFSSAVSGIVVKISNILINGVRLAYKEYHLEYISSPRRLGPISFDVPAMNGGGRFSGVYDSMQGGITFALPPRTGSDATAFGVALAQAGDLSPSKQLFFDANRYFIRDNRRMALANLCISFETGLADRLAEIARFRGDATLEDEINSSVLNVLGTGMAARTLGTSFERKAFWGDRFFETFSWLRVARNGILHKAQMNLAWNNQTRDFNQKAELQTLFSDYEWFMQSVDRYVGQVLASTPVTP